MLKDASKTVSSVPSTAWRRRLIVALCIVWIAFIFATSCTVVRTPEFFAWIHAHLLTSDAIFSRFETFWGVAWFTVVKGWHAAEYAVLLLLAVAALTYVTGRSTRRTLLAAIFCSILFAISDEWHQTFVPERNGTVSDVFIDSLGILAAALVVLRGMNCRTPTDTEDTRTMDKQLDASIAKPIAPLR